MMATLDVEFEAVSDADGRFARLAQLLGLADADHARGKVEHLWMACTTRGETDLPQWLVEKHLGAAGPAALVEAELARWGRGRGDSKTRRMYICGAKQRCLWLRHNQEQAPKGGKARAAKAIRGSSGQFQPNPAPSPSPSPSPGDPESLPPARDPAVPDPVHAPEPTAHRSCEVAKPATPGETTLDQLWAEFELERQRVAAALRIELLPLAAHDRGRNDLAQALAAARQAGERELEVKRIRRAIAVAGSEAEGSQDPQWLTGAVFTQDNLRRQSGTTPAKAKQAAAERRAAAQARARGPSGKAEVPPMPTPPKFKPEPPPRSPEELAADWAAVKASRSPPADRPTSEILPMFGDPEARAGPSSAAPTDNDPDENHRRKERRHGT